MGVPSGYTSAQVVQAVPTGIQSALVLISQTTTTAATQTFTNVFSATYDVYELHIFAGVASSTQGLLLRYANSGTPVTSGNYNFGNVRQSTGAVDAHDNATATSYDFMNNISDGFCFTKMTILNPFATAITRAVHNSRSSARTLVGGCTFGLTTSFDGFQLLNGNGSTFDYTTTIYGYTKS